MKKDESTNSLIQRFISLVEQQFQSLLWKRRITLGLIFLTIIVAGFLVGSILEHLFYLPAAAKIAISGILLLAATGFTVYYFRQLNPPIFKDFYHQFGKQHSLPQLSDALDLHFHAPKKNSDLHQAAIKQNLDTLNLQKVKSRLNNFTKQGSIHRYYRAGLSAMAGTLLLLIAFATWQSSAINRFAHIGTSYTAPNPYEYTIEPGSITLEQGAAFTPEINFSGDIPDDISLAFKTDVEENYRQREASQVEENRASFSSISPNTDGNYYFLMDGFRSEEFEISIQLRPRLEQLSVEIIPPDYTRLDTSSYSYPFSQIQAYAGSQLRLHAVTNKPVDKLALFRSALSDSGAIALNPFDSLSFQHQWQISDTDTVTFEMSDSAGLSNKNKFRFVVDPRDDQTPYVNLLEPSENLQMKTAEEVQLRYEAGDDFGLTSASLKYEHQQAFKSEAESGEIELDQPAMNSEHSYLWKVPEIKPKPRDVITYWIEVTDNDSYNGYKAGRSQKMMITFPSMTEHMEELESQENEVTESFEDISESFEQMEQKYNQFKKDLKRNPEGDNWEQKQQLEEVDKEREEINNQVEDLNKKFEEIRKKIEQSQAISPETRDAYDELQKLMKEIDSPELSEALEELQKSMGEMNPQQMREALEDYEFNEERYKERIERTKELFKSLRLNSDLDKMAQSLEELAEQEQQINESEQPPAEDLKQQEAVQQDFEELQKNLEELGNDVPEKAEEQIQELKEESGQQMDQTKKELQENIERLKKEQNGSESDPQTREQQRQIQKQMQQMAQQMNSAKQQMNSQQRQINAQALEYILYSMINLSNNQEELTKETENLPARSQGFVEKARTEQNISQQFSMLSDSLFQLSSEIPGFSNQINKKKGEVEQQLNRAVNMLSERNKSNSTFAQRQSLGGINELASMVASLLDQLQNQQGGGSGGSMSMQQLMEQIKKMSGQQQKLNQQIQEMINDMQGDRLSQDQMDRLNQLSKQQNRIRKQIKEMQQKGELDSGDRVLSEMQRMSEEMEDAINDLRGGQLDGTMMERQENILSRMLSAEKAVQERGKKKEREATTAEEQEQSTPPDITLEELQQRIRKMLNDPDRTEFTEDYQRLIEQYFELLKEQEKDLMR